MLIVVGICAWLCKVLCSGAQRSELQIMHKTAILKSSWLYLSFLIEICVCRHMYTYPPPPYNKTPYSSYHGPETDTHKP